MAFEEVERAYGEDGVESLPQGVEDLRFKLVAGVEYHRRGPGGVGCLDQVVVDHDVVGVGGPYETWEVSQSHVFQPRHPVDLGGLQIAVRYLAFICKFDSCNLTNINGTDLFLFLTPLLIFIPIKLYIYIFERSSLNPTN